MDRMVTNHPSRRQFVQAVGAAGLALVAGCGRWPWQPEQPAKVPRIGYLSVDPAPSGVSPRLEAFRQGLGALRYVEGENVIIEYRFADPGNDQLAEAAAELVQLGVDLIVAVSTPEIRAAKQVTRALPIVMVNPADPVGAGLVPGLAQPSGNVTGLSAVAPGLNGRRVELLLEAIPRLSHLGVIRNGDNPALAAGVQDAQDAASAFGLQLAILEVREANPDFTSAFEAARREGVEALLIMGDAVTLRERSQIAALAIASSLPAMYMAREYVDAGGLMSYGPDFSDLSRRAATYVDKILRGARPAELPVGQPTKFDFIVNLRAAHALGLTLPRELLLDATQVLQ